MHLAKVVLFSTIVTLNTGCILDEFDSAESITKKFNQSITDKNYGLALEHAKKLTDKEPKKFESFLFLSEGYAQVGDKSASLSALSTSINLGLKDVKKIIDDPLLDPIKKSAGFNELMAEKFGYKTEVIETVDSIMKMHEAKVDSMMSDTTTSITDKNGKTVIKAGDVEIEVDNE